jgi:hypothetical protein
MTILSLDSIEEHLAKAKEDAAFWERARAIMADPRMKAISASEPQRTSSVAVAFSAPSIPQAYGELKKNVYAVLPDADANIGARVTTQQIVSSLKQGGYVFKAKEPTIAVNGALMTLEEKGLAESCGKRGNAKLWRKKRQKSQEAPEGAS